MGSSILRRASAALAAAALLLPLGAARASTRPVAANAALNAEASALEARMPEHLWYGQVFGTYFSSPDRQPGEEIGLGSKGDSGLWSGVYLAAESFRYAVLKNDLAHARGAGDRAALEAQISEAKARIDTMLDMVHIRIHISKNWKREPADPSRAPQDGPLGGLYDAEEGLLFRNCFPAGVPSWQQDEGPNRHRQVFGPIPWDDGRSYFCEDAASRDTYAGTTFGMLAAFDLVGPDDAALRHEIRDDIFTMVGYIARHGWGVWKPYSRVNTTGSENFIFPLFLINPQPRLNLAQAARHVADADGTLADRLRWGSYWSEELAAMGPLLAPEYLLAIESPNNSYYNFNLNHLTNFNVIREEPDPSVREYLKREFAIIDASTRDDVNAHFEAITFALTGERARLRRSIAHLGDWIAYRNSTADPHNSARCGTDLRCVPQDLVDFHQRTPAGSQEVDIPGSSTTMRSATPLLVEMRAPQQDFLWQRSPYQLDGGYDPQDEEPGVDFLLPYWMLRYYTEVAPPALAPFPKWDGPTAGGSED